MRPVRSTSEAARARPARLCGATCALQRREVLARRPAAAAGRRAPGRWPAGGRAPGRAPRRPAGRRPRPPGAARAPAPAAAARRDRCAAAPRAPGRGSAPAPRRSCLGSVRSSAVTSSSRRAGHGEGQRLPRRRRRDAVEDGERDVDGDAVLRGAGRERVGQRQGEPLRQPDLVGIVLDAHLPGRRRVGEHLRGEGEQVGPVAAGGLPPAVEVPGGDDVGGDARVVELEQGLVVDARCRGGGPAPRARRPARSPAGCRPRTGGASSTRPARGRAG